MTQADRRRPNDWQPPVPNPPLPPKILDYARALRADSTDTEGKLWSCLRNRRMEGFKFRRQHPIGQIIVDFYCQEARLAIELDGSQHEADDRAKEHDRRRDQELSRVGIRVLRFWNPDVQRNLRGVLQTIWDELMKDRLCTWPRPRYENGGKPGGV